MHEACPHSSSRLRCELKQYRTTPRQNFPRLLTGGPRAASSKGRAWKKRKGKFEFFSSKTIEVVPEICDCDDSCLTCILPETGGICICIHKIISAQVPVHQQSNFYHPCIPACASHNFSSLCSSEEYFLGDSASVSPTTSLLRTPHEVISFNLSATMRVIILPYWSVSTYGRV